RIPQKFDSLATLTRPAPRAFSLALALFCLSAMQPASAQQNFFLNADADISLFRGNETDPAMAVNPNAATNIFVAGVSSATNGLFTTYSTNSTTWAVPSIVASAANTNHLVPA